MTKHILAFLLLFQLAFPAGPSRDQDYFMPYMIGGATSLALAGGLVYTYLQYRSLQQSHNEVVEKLRALERSFQATPFEDFRSVANSKIHDVRSLADKKIQEITAASHAELEAAVTAIEKTSDTHLHRIMADINKLEGQRRKFETEIRETRQAVGDAQKFLEEIKDEKGNQFLNSLMRTKRQAEGKLQQLLLDRDQLESQLRSLRTFLVDNQAVVADQKEVMQEVRQRLSELTSFVHSHELVEADIARIREIRSSLSNQVERLSADINKLRRRLEEILPSDNSHLERLVQQVLQIDERMLGQLQQPRRDASVEEDPR